MKTNELSKISIDDFEESISFLKDEDNYEKVLGLIKLDIKNGKIEGVDVNDLSRDNMLVLDYTRRCIENKVFDLGLSPTDYFEELKKKKNVVNNDYLNSIRIKTIQFYEDYKRTSQIDGMKYLKFLHESVSKELKLLELGVDTFIYEKDIIKYIEEVSDEVVKIQELKHYKRKIPDRIIPIIESTKDIFDDFLIVYTDYTKELSNTLIEKDPILFGVFFNKETGDTVERYYYLGDWIDEYCDLTLSKMIEETVKKSGNDITNEIKELDSIKRLEKEIGLKDNSIKDSFIRRIIKLWKEKMN